VETYLGIYTASWVFVTTRYIQGEGERITARTDVTGCRIFQWELDRFAAGKPLANFIRRLPGLGLGSVTMMVMYI
jgi:hypothetical protein